MKIFLIFDTSSAQLLKSRSNSKGDKKSSCSSLKKKKICFPWKLAKKTLEDDFKQEKWKNYQSFVQINENFVNFYRTIGGRKLILIQKGTQPPYPPQSPLIITRRPKQWRIQSYFWGRGGNLNVFKAW